MVWTNTSATKPDLNPPALPTPQLYQPGDQDPTSSQQRNNRTERAKGKLKVDDKNKKKSREAPQGNYKAYYTRRRHLPSLTASTSQSASAASSDTDPRLALIPPEWLRGKKVLDVGCNAGVVSIEVAQKWGAEKVTGVDIDADLVRQAWGNSDLAWSRQAPLERLQEEAAFLSSESSPSSKRPSRKASRSRSPSPIRTLAPLPTSPSANPFGPRTLAHFPLSLPLTFGRLPRPSSLLTRYVPQPEIETQGVLRKGKRKVMDAEEKTFPENIRFRCKDWLDEEVEEDREGYDVIIAFSITKWIHLTSLNPGLLTFFRKCFTLLHPGGRLILEPQPFSSYSRSIKNLRHSTGAAELQANYERLVEGPERGWRVEDGEFEKVLLEGIGFEKVVRLGWTGEEGSSWRRPVIGFEKRAGGSWGV
ncbi:hypothetical protein JCM11641_000845 [Rhodosporidiobolus odoratus]